MSPEQASGQALDGRSDLFAVGVMLWELLVGRQLFLAEDMRGTLAAVLFGTVPPPPRRLRKDVPKDLERVVMKLLERGLAARYPSAEAALADLARCLDASRDGRAALRDALAASRASGARARDAVTSPGDLRQGRAVEDAATVVGSRGRARPEQPKRRAAVLALFTVVVALMGGTLAYALLSTSTRSAASATNGPGIDAERVATSPSCCRRRGPNRRRRGGSRRRR